MFGSLISAIGLSAAQNATQAQSQSAQAAQAYQNMNALNAYYGGQGGLRATQSQAQALWAMSCPTHTYAPDPRDHRFDVLATQMLNRRYPGLCADLGETAHRNAVSLYHQRIRSRANDFPAFMSALDKAHDEPSDDNTAMLMVMARLVGIVDPDDAS